MMRISSNTHLDKGNEWRRAAEIEAAAYQELAAMQPADIDQVLAAQAGAERRAEYRKVSQQIGSPDVPEEKVI